jgi:DsbC/DsbD-like thiol-disulfide interchange protein
VDLEIEAVDGIEFGDPVYPKGQPYRLQGTDEDLSTYQGDIEIVVAVTATEAAPVGRRDIHGELRFQACNSQVCLFPASVAVTLSIDIDPAE